MILLGTEKSGQKMVVYAMSRGQYGNSSRIVWGDEGWSIHDADHGDFSGYAAPSPEQLVIVPAYEPGCDRNHVPVYCLAIMPGFEPGEYEWTAPVVELTEELPEAAHAWMAKEPGSIRRLKTAIRALGT